MWLWSTALEPEGEDTLLTPSALHVHFHLMLSVEFKCVTQHNSQPIHKFSLTLYKSEHLLVLILYLWRVCCG